MYVRIPILSVDSMAVLCNGAEDFTGREDWQPDRIMRGPFWNGESNDAFWPMRGRPDADPKVRW